jgi:hypothetical protein
MRFHVRLLAIVVASAAMAAVGSGCGDDSPDETRADQSTGSTTTTTEPDAPASSPDPSEPGSTVPPSSPPPSPPSSEAGGTLPDRPAELSGQVTDSEGGRFLIEERPDEPDAGRKAWVAIEGPVFEATEGGDPSPAAASDIEVGQQVSAWTGLCALSYPEQCGAEALVIE